MIIQYLIDWTYIHRCIDTARDDVYVERLRVSLSDLRKAIETNGILVKDNSGNVLIPLNNLKHFVGDLADEADGPYSYLGRELGNWLTLYENREREIEIDDTTSDENLCLMKCIHAWSEHLRRIAPQGINGFVVITDKVAEEISEGENNFFTCKTIDGYEGSNIALLQKEWARPMTFSIGDDNSFKNFINAFAAATEGVVTIADPYWATIALPEYEYEDNRASTYESETEKKKRRWAASTKTFIEPLMSNSLVNTISFISTFPSDSDNSGNKHKDCICLSTGTIQKTIQGIQIRRHGALAIQVIIVKEMERKKCEARSLSVDFHDRYVVGDTYTMMLSRGLDVCDRNGCVDHEFRITSEICANPTTKDFVAKQLKQCHINGYERRIIKPEEIDIPSPYELVIRSNPTVKLAF